jgi:hypothetical protein
MPLWYGNGDVADVRCEVMMKARQEMANREHWAVVDGEMDTPHFDIRPWKPQSA